MLRIYGLMTSTCGGPILHQIFNFAQNEVAQDSHNLRNNLNNFSMKRQYWSQDSRRLLKMTVLALSKWNLEPLVFKYVSNYHLESKVIWNKVFFRSMSHSLNCKSRAGSNFFPTLTTQYIWSYFKVGKLYERK